ncbi:hypothetical protein Dalk_1207 [Desulfatibacillum aliphaticivorans]|uniref:Uncharacterized protein n=1 Tax=Desulfatibacillum aliphaticivorans TaxID=218208 RepID=B8F9G4_DESAL|nr:DUF4329 domain-containing protein [Desulfatibacillum aliphaticivorans]ACL02910.1 hypothetical protein Dalk_1207 [Desulfatibacillum aliphaticivorans]
MATKYIFGADRRIAKITDGEGIQYFSKDHLGSSTVVTDDSGAVVEQADYRPFGEYRFYTGTVATPTPYKYTDQELDESTGLYNYDARHYDPAIGRFISPDSLIPNLYDPQQLNPYAYCRNNPLIYVDPTGHEPRQPFNEALDATIDFEIRYNDDSIRNNVEYSTVVYSFTNENGKKQYVYDYPTIGTENSNPPVPDSIYKDDLDYSMESLNETHGADDPNYSSNQLSPQDKVYARTLYERSDKKIDLPSYSGFPNGYLVCFKPSMEEIDPRTSWLKGVEIVPDVKLPCDKCEDKKRNAWEMGPDDPAYGPFAPDAGTTESNMRAPARGREDSAGVGHTGGGRGDIDTDNSTLGCGI